MTKREMMMEAHKRAKGYDGDYQACLSLALKEILRGGEKVELHDIEDKIKEITGLEYLTITADLVRERFVVEEVRWVRGRRKSKFYSYVKLDITDKAKEIISSYRTGNIWSICEQEFDKAMQKLREENLGYDGDCKASYGLAI